MVTDIFTGDFCRGRGRAGRSPGRAPQSSAARRYLPAPRHVGTRWVLDAQEESWCSSDLRFGLLEERKCCRPRGWDGAGCARGRGKWHRSSSRARVAAALTWVTCGRTMNKCDISVPPKLQTSCSRPKACACSSGTAGGERGQERGRGAGVAPAGRGASGLQMKHSWRVVTHLCLSASVWQRW